MLLGFLVVDRVESADGFMGGYLLTDERGYPREFRTTNPVRPTPVQQALFGSSLPAFVGVELCGRRLLDAAANTAAIVLVDDVTLLRLAARPHTSVLHLVRSPLERSVDPATGEVVYESAPAATAAEDLAVEAHVSTSDAPPPWASAADGQSPPAVPGAQGPAFGASSVWHHGQLQDPAGVLAPLVYRGVFAPGTDPTALLSQLGGVLAQFDLLEAFGRVRTALEIVGGQARHGS